MASHSSTLAWKLPRTEEPGRLQSMGSLRVGHDWATSLSLFTSMHWRRKWQPTPVFLPGESQERGAWWAAICGVAQSRTRLKWLSSSSSMCMLLPVSYSPSFSFTLWFWCLVPNIYGVHKCWWWPCIVPSGNLSISWDGVCFSPPFHPWRQQVLGSVSGQDAIGREHIAEKGLSIISLLYSLLSLS